jgi:hypothetical protein
MPPDYLEIFLADESIPRPHAILGDEGEEEPAEPHEQPTDEELVERLQQDPEVQAVLRFNAELELA